MFKNTEHYSRKYLGELDRVEAEKILNTMEGKTPYIFRYSKKTNEIVMSIKGLETHGFRPIEHFTLSSVVGKIDFNNPEQIEAAVRVARQFVEDCLSGKTEEKNLGRYLNSAETRKAFLESSYGTKYLTSEEAAVQFRKPDNP